MEKLGRKCLIFGLDCHKRPSCESVMLSFMILSATVLATFRLLLCRVSFFLLLRLPVGMGGGPGMQGKGPKN